MRAQAPAKGALSCGGGLLCLTLAKGPLADAKLGYCATKKEALAAGALRPAKQPECGKACIAGAVLGGAVLAGLLVSGAWWLTVRRKQAKCALLRPPPTPRMPWWPRLMQRVVLHAVHPLHVTPNVLHACMTPYLEGFSNRHGPGKMVAAGLSASVVPGA
jgi:hypothetical protein